MIDRYQEKKTEITDRKEERKRWSKGIKVGMMQRRKAKENKGVGEKEEWTVGRREGGEDICKWKGTKNNGKQNRRKRWWKEGKEGGIMERQKKLGQYERRNIGKDG